MGSSMYSRLAAAGFGLALWSSAAFCAPLVTGSTVSGRPGDVVKPELTIQNAGDAVDVSRIATWDFLLSWDATVLALDVDKSTMQIGGSSYTLPQLYSYLENTVGGTVDKTVRLFRWADTTNFATVDLSGDIIFSGWFEIVAGSAPGVYPITLGTDVFPSSLSDETAVEYTYYTDTTQQSLSPAMFVRVQDAPPLPEPGSLSLFAGVLGALYLVARRRQGRE